jgi:hypothetical protein
MSIYYEYQIRDFVIENVMLIKAKRSMLPPLQADSFQGAS